MKVIDMIRFQLILVLFLLPVFIFAQGKEANYWYFGNKCGITFRDGSPPTALLDGESVSQTQTGTACISDKDGNQLLNSSNS